MEEIRYHVVYRGKMLPGTDVDVARSKLMGTFSLNAETAAKILKSRQAVLKKNADADTAKRIGSALRRAGLDVALVQCPSETDALSLPVVPDAPPTGPPPVAPPSAKPPLPPEPAPVREAESSRTTLPVAASRQIFFEFTGRGSEYFKIWIVNIILSIVTLGIYSAWAKVRRRQYFYGSTRLDGASFEYLADPLKILKGRAIIAAAVLLYSILNQLMPLAGIVTGLVLLIALPWVVIRSLAFNARNSSLRNIRFGFTGRIKEAAVVFVLLPFLTALTLGILFPYAFFRQKKFVIENSTYGTTRFSFDATAKDYYRLCVGALIPTLIGLVAFGAAAFLLAPVSPLVLLVLYLYLFAFFTVKTINLQFNASRLGPHHFDAGLRVWAYIVLLITNSCGIALTLGLFQPWAKIRTVRYKLAHISLHASGDIDGFIAGQQKQVSAIGDELSDFFDMDFGL